MELSGLRNLRERCSIFRAGDAVYFLLADHRHEGAKTRGWAGFSGGGNKGESRAETAARQTEEETRGYYSREVLLRKIESVEPIHDGGFTFYFVEVDFVPAVRVANHQKGTKEEDLLERGPYAWIPWTEIKKYLGSDIDRRRTYPIDRRYLPEGRNTHWFWPLWLGNLRRAVETGALPWED